MLLVILPINLCSQIFPYPEMTPSLHHFTHTTLHVFSSFALSLWPVNHSNHHNHPPKILIFQDFAPKVSSCSINNKVLTFKLPKHTIKTLYHHRPVVITILFWSFLKVKHGCKTTRVYLAPQKLLKWIVCTFSFVYIFMDL